MNKISQNNKALIRTKETSYTKVITITGIFIAISLVIKTVTSFYPNLSMRISLSGPFSNFPGIIFGPLIGGITKMLVDIIGFLIKPVGAYNPLFTITAILGGVITPLVWQRIKDTNIDKLKKIMLGFFILIGFFGLFNHYHISIVKDSTWANYIALMSKGKLYTTFLLELTSILGLFLYFVDFIITKKYTNKFLQDNFLKLVMAIGAGGLVVTTLNTFVLKLFIPALSGKSFMVLYIPRLIEEILNSIYVAIALAFLLNLYRTYISKNKIIKE